MKISRLLRLLGGIGLMVVCFTSSSRAQTFNVSPFGIMNTAFTINSQQNPTLTLTQGVSYVFVLSGTSIHPFWIKTAATIGTGNAYNDGVSNNGATSGSVTFNVPATAPATLFYHCQNHGPMGGQINIVAAPSSPPPVVKVVYIFMNNQNVTVKSTGATNWSVFPEFKCDFASTNWFPVVNFTNFIANGTNTTTFNRSEAICGSISFVRIRNQQN